MARHAVGDQQQARELLARANEWSDDVLSKEASLPNWKSHTVWARRLRIEILRREATETILSDANHEEYSSDANQTESKEHD
jgi:hypothetical protein